MPVSWVLACLLLVRLSSALFSCGDEKVIQSPKECPPECPYVAKVYSTLCQARCVAGSGCADSKVLQTFPDNQTKHCRACRVSGCRHCDGRHDLCKECRHGFHLSPDDGQCVMKSTGFLYVFLVVVGIAVVIVLIYLLCLWTRPAENADVERHAVITAERSTLRDTTISGSPPYPLTTSLLLHAVGGRGTYLFFHHMAALLMWAVLVAVSLGCIDMVYGLSPEGSSREEMCGSGHDAEEHSEDRDTTENVVFWFVSALYVCSFAGSLALSVCQRIRFRDYEAQSTGMEDYALLARGFPREGGSDEVFPRYEIEPEEEYKQFIESVLGKPVVGVSVMWDYHHTRAAVRDLVAREVCEVEWGKNNLASARQSSSRPCLAPLDDLLVGSGGEDQADDAEVVNGLSGGEAMATSLATTGYAVIVFKTKEDLDYAMERFGVSEDAVEFRGFDTETGDAQESARKGSISRVNVPRFRDEFPIDLEVLPCGPSDLFWGSFGGTYATFLKHLAISIGSVALFIFVWLILFYAPYAYFILYSSTVPGQAMEIAGGLHGTLLGLVISIGNQMVYAIIAYSADKAGFMFRSKRQNFSVTLYTVAVFINTCMDLWTVMILAQGQQLDEMFHVDEGRASLNPSAEEAFSCQLFSYLVPGTILLPFFFEPVVMLLFGVLGRWVVRSRPDIGHFAAESILSLAEFDLGRYGDNIINILLCTIMLFITSSKMFEIFCYLVVSTVFIFFWDKYRLLRVCRATIFSLDYSENFAHFLHALPCGLLAGCIAYRGSKLGFYTIGGELLGISNERWFLAAAIAAHVVVHIFAIFLVHKYVSTTPILEEEQEMDKTFEEFASEHPASWFNLNPIYCLRSKYIFHHEPPCIYYIRGKEDLLWKHPEIGCFFDGEELAAQERAVESEVSEEGEEEEEEYDEAENGHDEDGEYCAALLGHKRPGTPRNGTPRSARA